MARSCGSIVDAIGFVVSVVGAVVAVTALAATTLSIPLVKFVEAAAGEKPDAATHAERCVGAVNLLFTIGGAATVTMFVGMIMMSTGLRMVEKAGKKKKR